MSGEPNRKKIVVTREDVARSRPKLRISSDDFDAARVCQSPGPSIIVINAREIRKKRKIRISTAEIIAARPGRRNSKIAPEEITANRKTIIILEADVPAGKNKKVAKIYIGPEMFGKDIVIKLHSRMIDPVIDTTTHWLYRGDTRSPEVIFNQGFKPKGGNNELSSHVSSCFDSIFVSTSRQKSVARPFAGYAGYVYLIENDGESGIDLNQTFARAGMANPFQREIEVAFYLGIDRDYICMARSVSGMGAWLAKPTPNPNRKNLPADAWRQY